MRIAIMGATSEVAKDLMPRLIDDGHRLFTFRFSTVFRRCRFCAFSGCLHARNFSLLLI